MNEERQLGSKWRKIRPHIQEDSESKARQTLDYNFKGIERYVTKEYMKVNSQTELE